jgi:DNA-binding winged helix-turn-helix (wHTH) protein
MTSRSYRFGDYRIEPALREVWCGERLIALPPQVFDCLAYLVQHHDRAVSRDELVSAVWGKDEVSDTLLGQTILRIRRTLGDDAKDPHTLRTIARFGYRWVAPLDIRESAAAAVMADEAVGTADVVAAPLPGKSSAMKWIAISTAVVALVVVGSVLFRRDGLPARPLPPVSTGTAITAVLPADIDAESEWAWARLGMMDIVATRLRSAGVPSVPSEEVVTLLNTPAERRSANLRETLNAPLLITPRVRKREGNFEVTLDADGDGGRRYTAVASARDVAAAGRAAADQFLVALGRMAPSDNAESTADAVLVKRIDAAVLADDPDTARALIAAAAVSERESPEVRLRLAKIDYRGGRLDAARTRLQALLDAAPAQSAPVLRASVLNGLGAVAVRADDAAQAETFFSEAISLLEGRQEPALLGQAYLGRAAAAAELRHIDAASADYSRARIALRQANDTLALIRVAADEGFLDVDQGRYAQALPQLAEATRHFQQWGALNEAVLTSIGQIACHLALLDSRAALQVADDAEAFARHLDNPTTLESLALARVRALAGVGRLREAREGLQHLRGASKDATMVAAADAMFARLELENGQVRAARELAGQAVAALDAPGDAGLRADAWLTSVRADLAGTDGAKAEANLRALETWAAQTDEPRARLYARLTRAEYLRRQGQGWREAFELAREAAAREAPYAIAQVAEAYVPILLAEGDGDAAAVEAGRVSRWSEQDFGCAVLEARLYAALGRGPAHQGAVARARSLAGERPLPDEAVSAPLTSSPSVR